MRQEDFFAMKREVEEETEWRECLHAGRQSDGFHCFHQRSPIKASDQTGT